MVLQFPICLLMSHASLDIALCEGWWMRCSVPGEPAPSTCCLWASSKWQKWPAPLDHLPELGKKGWPFPPALFCGTVQKKVAKSKTLFGACCFLVCIQLKSWSPFPSLAALFCHLHQGRLPQNSEEVTVNTALNKAVVRAEKKIVQALFSQHLEAQPTWKLHLVCYKQRGLTFLQANFSSSQILTNSKAVSCPCWLKWEAAMIHCTLHGYFICVCLSICVSSATHSLLAYDTADKKDTQHLHIPAVWDKNMVLI